MKHRNKNRMLAGVFAVLFVLQTSALSVTAFAEETQALPIEEAAALTETETVTEAETETEASETEAPAASEEEKSVDTAEVQADVSSDGEVNLIATAAQEDGLAVEALTETVEPVPVKTEGGKKLDSKYYTVSYNNNKKAGKATVAIKFKDHYEGTLKLTFKIVPAGTKLTKARAKKKAIALSWKKQAKETCGYQIQYAT
jgi:hypothetical protein